MITSTLPQNKTINFVYKQCNQFVDICDIEYIEANEWLCKIYTADGEIICAKRLNYLLMQRRCGHIPRLRKINY